MVWCTSMPSPVANFPRNIIRTWALLLATCMRRLVKGKCSRSHGLVLCEGLQFGRDWQKSGKQKTDLTSGNRHGASPGEDR